MVHHLSLTYYLSMKKTKRPILLAIYLVAVSFLPISAQTSSNATPFAVGLRGHYGFIIPHSEAIQDQADSNPWGIELDASVHLVGEKTWARFASFPRVGVTLSYVNFDNPEVIGSSISLATYFEPTLAIRNRLNFSFRMGTGITYLTQPFHPETNPENQFYSSHISFILMANVMANYRISPYLQARAGVFYNHISNGGIKQPNKGINFPTASIGLEYLINPYDFKARPKTDWRTLHTDRFRVKTAFFGTAKTLNNEDSRRYAIVGLTGYGSYIIGRMSALTAGVEWVADFAQRQRLRNQSLDNDFNKGSFNIGHELLLGKFTFSQQLGFYWYRDTFDKPFYFQRYGLEYAINSKYFVGFNLKAHGDIADFLDFRAGIVF